MVVSRVAMVSMHTSPVSAPGTADAGGMNVSVMGVAEELAARGTEVDLLTRAVGTPSSRLVLPGVRLHELAAGGGGTIAKHDLPRVSDEFGEAVAALARRPDAGYDIIHAHYWLSGIASLPAALEMQIPFVQSFHTLAAMKNAASIPDAPPEPVIRERSEAFLAAQASAVIASSSAEASAAIDLAGAPAERTWIIPPGVDLALFSPRQDIEHERVRAALGLEPDRPLIVIAGRVQPLKGHDLAVRVLAEIAVMRGWAPVLVIAGEVTPGDAPFVAALRELAGELGVEPDVRFVGALNRETLADLLSAASVTLVPSYSETFGLVALESAACGTPVVAYRAGGLTESVEEGRSGIVLGTRDPRYWATEVAIILEDEERRERYAITGREHAQRFTWAAAATSLLGVYSGAGRP